MAGWISFSAYVSSPWSFEQRAYDEGDVAVPTTYAQEWAASGGWTAWLELYFSDGKPRLANKLKVWADSETNSQDYMDVDAYYNGQWNSVIYTGSYQEMWKQSGLGGTYLVERIRIRLKCSGSGSQWHRVYEAMLYEEDPVAPGWGNCILALAMNDNAADTKVKDGTKIAINGVFSDTGGDPNTDAHSVIGKVDRALMFDGVDDYVSVADDVAHDVGGALTIVFGFKTSVQDQGRPGLIIHDLSSYKYEILGGSGPSPSLGEIYFRINTTVGIGGCGLSKADDYYADGQWHQVIAMFDRTLGSKRLRMFVDGVWEASDNGDDADILDGDEGIIVGDGSSNKLAADIDVVFVFNRMLSDTELAWIWNKGDWTEWLFALSQMCSMPEDFEVETRLGGTMTLDTRLEGELTVESRLGGTLVNERCE